jgi:hypothetical protein
MIVFLLLLFGRSFGGGQKNDTLGFAFLSFWDGMGEGVFCFCFSMVPLIGEFTCTMNAFYMLVQYSTLLLFQCSIQMVNLCFTLPMCLCRVCFLHSRMYRSR